MATGFSFKSRSSSRAMEIFGLLQISLQIEPEPEATRMARTPVPPPEITLAPGFEPSTPDLPVANGIAEPEQAWAETGTMWQETEAVTEAKPSSLPAAVFAASAAVLVSTVLWVAITLITGLQIGWMAIGVGALVGLAVRALGRGESPVFGLVGAGFSLFGCLLGNLLVACVMFASEQQVPVLQILLDLDPELVVGLMTATFSPLDVLFYFVAITQGYKFAVGGR